jgi:hypothetical protein
MRPPRCGHSPPTARPPLPQLLKVPADQARRLKALGKRGDGELLRLQLPTQVRPVLARDDHDTPDKCSQQLKLGAAGDIEKAYFHGQEVEVNKHLRGEWVEGKIKMVHEHMYANSVAKSKGQRGKAEPVLHGTTAQIDQQVNA